MLWGDRTKKEENVYIYASPYILEWITMNRYGGRIVDSSGTVFSGSLDSDEALQAAEWLFWVNTQLEDYRERPINGDDTYWPMPYDLIEDNMALAVDYPYYLSAPRITSYSGIMEQNERISIAPLPGGNGVINPALMSGLAIHTGSKNKEGAMKLLRYLLEESDDFYQDTVVQTHQVGAKGALLNKDTEEWSVLLQEVTRSVPVSLMMNEGSQWANSIAQIRLNKLYRAMKNGQPAKEVLEGYAEEFDMQFEEFKEDLNNYSRYTNWI